MLVHHVEEVLQDLEVEGGSEHLPPGSSSSSSSSLPGLPLSSRASQQPLPQPGPERRTGSLCPGIIINIRVVVVVVVIIVVVIVVATPHLGNLFAARQNFLVCLWTRSDDDIGAGSYV